MGQAEACEKFLVRARSLERVVGAIETPLPYLVAKKAGLESSIERAAAMFARGWHDRAECELDVVEAELSNVARKYRGDLK